MFEVSLLPSLLVDFKDVINTLRLKYSKQCHFLIYHIVYPQGVLLLELCCSQKQCSKQCQNISQSECLDKVTNDLSLLWLCSHICELLQHAKHAYCKLVQGTGITVKDKMVKLNLRTFPREILSLIHVKRLVKISSGKYSTPKYDQKPRRLVKHYKLPIPDLSNSRCVCLRYHYGVILLCVTSQLCQVFVI